MRDIPRLCTDDVVRNILSGAQTQDRRPLKPQPQALEGSWYWRGGAALERVGYGADYVHTNRDAMVRAVEAVSPRVGDRIWVRECWAPYADYPRAAYRATWTGDLIARWRPSIHMPRWACRIVLPITRSWVERIQEVSETDAMAEGVRGVELGVGAGDIGPGAPRVGYTSRAPGDERSLFSTAREAFRAEIWEPLYPGSWERNDWVGGTAWDKPEMRGAS